VIQYNKRKNGDGDIQPVEHLTGHGVCWISHTPDQDAPGFEPASEKGGAGSITLAGRESFYCKIEVGQLHAGETQRKENLEVKANL